MTMVNGPYLTLHFSGEFAFAPRPGAAHIAMTIVNGPYLTRYSKRICICAAPGRGAPRSDNGKRTLPDTLRRTQARRTSQ
eukprot:7190114-Karenia_brevis.AAC.1